MFYIAAAPGFLLIKNTEAGPNKTTWTEDVRIATPFETWDEADAAARGRAHGYFAVLSTSHLESM